MTFRSRLTFFAFSVAYFAGAVLSVTVLHRVVWGYLLGIVIGVAFGLVVGYRARANRGGGA